MFKDGDIVLVFLRNRVFTYDDITEYVYLFYFLSSNFASYSLVDIAWMKLRLAVVFGVHYFIRIPSLCYICHVVGG